MRKALGGHVKPSWSAFRLGQLACCCVLSSRLCVDVRLATGVRLQADGEQHKVAGGGPGWVAQTRPRFAASTEHLVAGR